MQYALLWVRSFFSNEANTELAAEKLIAVFSKAEQLKDKVEVAVQRGLDKLIEESNKLEEEHMKAIAKLNEREESLKATKAKVSAFIKNLG